MAIKCKSCSDGQVPATGRAAEQGLCCKCDRIQNGPQTQEEKAIKERRPQQNHWVAVAAAAAQTQNS